MGNKNVQQWIRRGAYALGGAWVLLVAAYALRFHGHGWGDPAAWGQFGDYLAGLLNPLIGTLTLVGLAATVVMQGRLLQQALEDSKEQRKEVAHSLAIATKSAEAAWKSAEAAQRTMEPILVPIVTSRDLNTRTDQLMRGSVHKPKLHVTFRNIGKTPAMLRSVSASLVLAEQDVLPPERPASPAKATLESIEPGETGGGQQATHPEIQAEVSRRLESNTGGKFARWHLVGDVKYADVFDTLHTRHFCIKVRQNGFTAARKGVEMNYTERQPLRVGDVEAVVEDE